MEVIKQFTIDETYSKNYIINKYENGHFQGFDVVASSDLDDCVTELKRLSYTVAYNPSKYKLIMEEAKRRYEGATKLYEFALSHQIFVPNTDQI